MMGVLDDVAGPLGTVGLFGGVTTGEDGVGGEIFVIGEGADCPVVPLAVEPGTVPGVDMGIANTG